ncbi:CheR family methyltransferase [Marinilabilia rubra]|uniref:Chemotaxis protein CheR n=1 Tax=Marinilabilia rubra TaxID=2162893 RepID=A0A2U2B8L4_9BACT|nr:protein-glutamate O-methyltransferase CheR [Marinilabilia rubra]PWD99405.1 chemotaxis protein CheR [Marinilabilia rubra]
MTYKEYLHVLKEHSPYDFSEYSDNSIFRRIQKVMRDHQISLEELGARTQADKLFVEEVVEAITVNTTELFRDPEVWRFLLEKHLPSYRSNNFINIWHAGCSTGQEVYSLLILFNELGLLDKVRVFATDISQKALEIAKKGAYKHQLDRGCIENFDEVFNNHSGRSVNFSKYFDVDEKKDEISVKPILKKNVKFIRHDLVKKELPFYNKMDFVFCRNVLIYFNIKLQTRIVQRFFDSLYANGTLVLGAHEGLSGFFKTKFDRQGPVYKKSNVFHFRY